METQTKNLRELSQDKAGNLTLEGRVVNPTLVGTPFVVMVTDRDFGEQVTMHNMDKAFKLVLQKKYAFPTDADAYLRSDSHQNYQNIFGSEESLRIYAVQPYKLGANKN